MLILRIWYMLVGYLLIDISGPSPEKVVNLAAARGVFMWGVRRVDARVLRVNVGIAAFRALRPLAKIAGCTVRIERKFGLPFLRHRLAARKALVVGCLLSASVVLYLSTFVWFVDISGGDTQKTGEASAIGQILRETGVSPGARRGELRLKDIEQDILERRPTLAWVSVSLEGTLLRVEYVAKTLPNNAVFDISDIIARKEGVITKIIPFTGQPHVAEGDTVQEGDVLIEGRGPPKTVIQPGVDGGAPQTVEYPGEAVRARGLVEATVYYEGYAEAPETSVRVAYTGRRSRAYTVRVGHHAAHFGDPTPFGEYDVKTKRVFAPRWRNHAFPVEVLVATFMEANTIVRTVSPETALASARKGARKLALSQVPRGAEVLDVSEEPIAVDRPGVEPGGGLVRFRVVVACREGIGVERVATAPPPDDGSAE